MSVGDSLASARKEVIVKASFKSFKSPSRSLHGLSRSSVQKRYTPSPSPSWDPYAFGGDPFEGAVDDGDEQAVRILCFEISTMGDPSAHM